MELPGWLLDCRVHVNLSDARWTAVQPQHMQPCSTSYGLREVLHSGCWLPLSWQHTEAWSLENLLLEGQRLAEFPWCCCSAIARALANNDLSALQQELPEHWRHALAVYGRGPVAMQAWLSDLHLDEVRI